MGLKNHEELLKAVYFIYLFYPLIIIYNLNIFSYFFLNIITFLVILRHFLHQFLHHIVHQNLSHKPNLDRRRYLSNYFSVTHLISRWTFKQDFTLKHNSKDWMVKQFQYQFTIIVSNYVLKIDSTIHLIKIYLFCRNHIFSFFYLRIWSSLILANNLSSNVLILHITCSYNLVLASLNFQDEIWQEILSLHSQSYYSLSLIIWYSKLFIIW